jgi:hypothetical protein
MCAKVTVDGQGKVLLQCGPKILGRTMSKNSDPFSKRISRRAILGTAAAMAATPALAEVCPIGPPAHEKGPKVLMDMD